MGYQPNKQQVIMTQIQKLPTIAELDAMELSTSEKNDALLVLLNQSPPPSFIKKHPTAKSVDYIPIDKVEFLLTKIFKHWWVEVKNVQTIANSAVVTVRLFYKDRFTGEDHFQDGIGAAPIHTKSGFGAMEWDKVNADSVMKAVPAAESYAIKDAAEKIGRIFGKDLNRKDVFSYDGMLDEEKFKDATITKK